MKICIKINGSKLEGIDMYEVADSSLETVLQSILGTYTTTSSNDGVLVVHSVPAPVEPQALVAQIDPTEDTLVPVQDLDQMSKVEWEYAMVAFQREGDLTKFTNWLDKVFKTTAFSSARSIHAIASKAPQISRLDYARWVQLVQNLENLSYLSPVSARTIRTYYNLALRLDE
jgi:hypothetical protein